MSGDHLKFTLHVHTKSYPDPRILYKAICQQMDEQRGASGIRGSFEIEVRLDGRDIFTSYLIV